MKNKVGMLTVKNAEISFHNCIIPKTNLLGQKGQGLNIAYSALIDGRLCSSRRNRCNERLSERICVSRQDKGPTWFTFSKKAINPTTYCENNFEYRKV